MLIIVELRVVGLLYMFEDIWKVNHKKSIVIISLLRGYKKAAATA